VYYVYIENARLRAMRRRSSDDSEPAAAPAGNAPHPVKALADAPPALQRSIEGGGRV
jgi:hypothetical protein